MTRVEQLQKTGIVRTGSPKKGFRYRKADGGRVSAADLARISDLGIPPAWTEVAINSLPGGRLQAVGKDAAGRWQYLYHQNHTRAQELKNINVTNRHINEYIKEIMGEKFSAKYFRTWAGTIICACALARVGTEPIEKGAARKRKLVAAIKETAETLGNTPAVCRSSYICPEVIDSFERGRIIDAHFETLEHLINYRGQKLHRAEHSLLKFLKRSAG